MTDRILKGAWNVLLGLLVTMLLGLGGWGLLQAVFMAERVGALEARVQTGATRDAEWREAVQKQLDRMERKLDARARP